MLLFILQSTTILKQIQFSTSPPPNTHQCITRAATEPPMVNGSLHSGHRKWWLAAASTAFTMASV